MAHANLKFSSCLTQIKHQFIHLMNFLNVKAAKKQSRNHLKLVLLIFVHLHS